eukprot:SM000019S05130  [mRNA]  locus=s19:1122804:1125791:- [translate_table: standard]
MSSPAEQGGGDDLQARAALDDRPARPSFTLQQLRGKHSRHIVFVPSAGGAKLDVTLYIPFTSAAGEKTASPSSPGLATVVLVHQYSWLGGQQMLLEGLALHLNELGYTCITFDMRGVQRSTGRASLCGTREVHDVKAVCEWASAMLQSDLLLVGSSAGAPIAGAAVDRLKDVLGFVGIGYTFGFWSSILFGRHYRAILRSPKPKLFIMGTRDGFTTVKKLESKLNSAAGVAERHLIDGVGHFELEGFRFDGYIAQQVDIFARRIRLGEFADTRQPTST